MDYGGLLRRTWQVIWEHKFLIMLGVLVALSSSGVGSSMASGTQWNTSQGMDWESRLPPDGQQIPPMPGMRPGPLVGVPVALIAFLAAVGLALGVAVWVASTLARGGLVTGVDAIDGGGVSSFREAFAGAWRRRWTLLAIAILPLVPGLFLIASALSAVWMYAGMDALIDGAGMGLPRMTLAVVGGALACLALPVSLILDLVRTFANQACMIECLGAWAAYKRGFSVLWNNLGSALLIFLAQIAISVALGVTMLLPSILLALCCLGWPIMLLVQGAIAAYFAALWTLAWRRWTDRRVGTTVGEV